VSLSVRGFGKGRVYAITPPSFELAQFLPLLDEVLAMGGVAALQLRLKNGKATGKATPISKVREYLPPLKKVCEKYKVPVVVNDVALVNEHVHLGKLDIGKVANQPQRIVGISCGNSIERAQAAAKMLAVSYVSFGAFYPTATKSDTVRCPVSILSQPAVRQLLKKIPVVAIGGINASNGQALLNRGVSYLAICSALWGEPERVLGAFRFNPSA